MDTWQDSMQTRVNQRGADDGWLSTKARFISTILTGDNDDVSDINKNISRKSDCKDEEARPRHIQ